MATFFRLRVILASFVLQFILFSSCVAAETFQDRVNNEPTKLTAQGSEGFFKVDPLYPRHFLYGGKPFFFISKSAFALIDADWKAYIDEAEKTGFTALRIWINRPSLTKKWGNDRFKRNQAEGDVWCFGGTPDKPDLSRFNEEYFQKLDAILDYMQSKRMVAELTLFTERDMKSLPDYWPGGSLAWNRLKERYIRFVIERYKRQPNVYFEIANEYYDPEMRDFVEKAGVFAWTIDNTHLITASAGDAERYSGKPWYQLHNIHPTRGSNWWTRVYAEEVIPARKKFSGPIVCDEPIGSVAPDDLESGYPGRDANPDRHRINAWMTTMAGAYVTFHSHKGIAALAGHNPGEEYVMPYRSFFEKIKFREYDIDNKIVKSGNAVAISSKKSSVIYLPEGGVVTLDLAPMKGTLNAYWYDTRNGKFGKKMKIPGGGERELAAPDQNDWALYFSR